MCVSIKRWGQFYSLYIARNRCLVFLTNVSEKWHQQAFCYAKIGRSQLSSAFWLVTGRRYPAFCWRFTWHCTLEADTDSVPVLMYGCWGVLGSSLLKCEWNDAHPFFVQRLSLSGARQPTEQDHRRVFRQWCTCHVSANISHLGSAGASPKYVHGKRSDYLAWPNALFHSTMGVLLNRAINW